MKTVKAFNSMLAKLTQNMELTEETEKDIENLKNTYIEATEGLKPYANEYAEDAEEYDLKDVTEIASVDNAPTWKEKYMSLEKRYRDRFFGSAQDNIEDALEETEESLTEDEEELTIDDLLRKKEE